DPEGAYLGLADDPEDIESARAAAAEMGLANIRFELVDWLEPPLATGPFDHVLCRGVLGRIPAGAEREVLRLCRAALAESGILYLDYPVAPGAFHRRLVHALIAPALEPGAPPARRVEQARAAASAFRAMITSAQHPYPQLLAM